LIGIALCIIQSAIFSGLNLAIFSLSKLRLEVEVAGGNRDASALLDLRKDSNLTLATVLWGNVTINVLLTLLSDSVLAGVRSVRLLHDHHHAIRRDYSASLFFAKCHQKWRRCSPAAADADVGQLEATGALNFLDLDDILVVEGEAIDPRSVITLPIENERPCCRNSNVRPMIRSCGV
jgi:metal transporter CNNM